jgi:hypothetical protein
MGEDLERESNGLGAGGSSALAAVAGSSPRVVRGKNREAQVVATWRKLFDAARWRVFFGVVCGDGEPVAVGPEGGSELPHGARHRGEDAGSREDFDAVRAL